MEKPEPPQTTLADCALSIGMTNDELTQYESDFGKSRSDLIDEHMCSLIQEYIQRVRKISGGTTPINKLINDGYIQKSFSIGPDEALTCQTMIVKRGETYYLLASHGGRKATMGLMKFDPNLTDWQEVWVMQNPSSGEWIGHTMRVVMQSPNLTSLEDEMGKYCRF